jgi:ferredoxin
MGCCTACAVRVKSGEMSQPEALGVAAELRERGFALMCVGFAKTDLVLELAEEDEVYDLQFGDVFGERATDPSNGESIEKDPFALEVAFYDE